MTRALRAVVDDVAAGRIVRGVERCIMRVDSPIVGGTWCAAAGTAEPDSGRALTPDEAACRLEHRACQNGEMQSSTTLPRLTDEELTALALAADPDVPVPADAVSLSHLTGSPERGLLPEWYMATPAGGQVLRGWRRRVVFLVIAALVTITAYGLCNTYGQLEHIL